MAQNDFLQFDENNENVLTQDAYREDEQRKSGAKSGVARSSLFNKVLRQVSTFVAGFGQFISEKNINILEDIDSVKTALTNLFTAKNIGVSAEVQELLGADNVDDGLLKAGVSDGIASYLSFVSNLNTDTVNAAFGYNNEDVDIGLGNALIMYSRYSGEQSTFNFLDKMLNFKSMNENQKDEILKSSIILNLLYSNDYASKMWRNYEERISTKQICRILGIPETIGPSELIANYGADIINNIKAFKIAFSSYNLFFKMCNNVDTATMMATNAVLSTMYSLINDRTVKNPISEIALKSTTYMDILFSSDRIATATCSAWSNAYSGKCLVLSGTCSNGGIPFGYRYVIPDNTEKFATFVDAWTSVYNVFDFCSSLDGICRNSAGKDFNVTIKYIPIT